MSFLQMSVAAAVMIFVITVIRTLTINRLPKKTFLALWGITLVRLLVPFSLPSVFSVYSLVGQSAPMMEMVRNTPAVIVLPIVPARQQVTAQGPIQDSASTISVWVILWLIGVLACALFFALTYWKCLREFRASLPVDNDFTKSWLIEHQLKRPISIRQSSLVSAPLTFGILHPVILMPKATDWNNKRALQYVLAHEYVHIRRFDTVTKLVLMVALCVHWFNPLVWVMYVLANRDLELSCDEAVIRLFGEDTKSTYARTLISMEETRRGLTPLCNSFSKNAIEERIMAIMKIKKTSLMALLIAVALVVGVGAAFATSAQALSSAEHVNNQKNESVISDVIMLSTLDANGNMKYTADGGKTYFDEDEFRRQYPVSDVEWWTYEEYKAWLDHEKVALQGMIGEKGWTGGRGEFVWTQEIVDESIAQYEKILEDIQNGLKVSKTVNGSEDMMLSSYDGADSALETAKGVAIALDNGETVTFGPYDTTEELLADLKPFCEEQVALGKMAQSEADEMIAKYVNSQH